MNLFRNLRITHQFLIVLGVLTAGFVAIGLAYNRVVAVDQASASQVQQANDFGDRVNRLASDLSDLNIEVDAFLLKPDLQRAETFDEIVARSEQQIAELVKTILERKALGLVTQLGEGLSKLDDTFGALVNARVLIGLDENHGLHGEMRAAVHAVEETLGTLGGDTLKVSMLEMRRHEKDFIQRADASYVQQMKQEQQTFSDLLKQSSIPAAAQATIAEEMATYAKAFDAFVRGFDQLNARHEDIVTTLYVLRPLLDSLREQKNRLIASNVEKATSERAGITHFFVGALVLVGLIIGGVLLLVAQRMRGSLGKLHSTVQQVAAGDFSARSHLATHDELGILGDAFDTLLDERVATLSEVERERDTLNDSIIELLGSVAKLAQKDLTIKAVVAEDVTGPVSDAVNLLTSETTAVLSDITDVSKQVERAANQVRAQAEKVTHVAEQERLLVQSSSDELRQAGITMTRLAKGAKAADDKAATAIEQTRNARIAVATTVAGIEQIRETIRETEKRIKRLGERSQEITGAVNLINTIAERTHILALNASMHAASAGEAGRGFAVVADEVQRLAESSRNATSDIASMVNAIRVETGDTVDTMNRVIEQVAEGTRRAQEAGERMGQTEITTAELVAAVQTIAAALEQQTRTALALMKRSQVIVKSTEETSEQLKEQSAHTLSLVDYSDALRRSVSVFKLPPRTA